MGCCWCCMDEGQKVTRCLEVIPATPLAQGQLGADGPIQKLVGRVVLAGTAPFYAPASGMPCVYYHLKVWEERIRHDRDSEGRPRTHRTWHKIFDREEFTDFFLQDMGSKVWINGSNRGQCRIASRREGGSNGYSMFSAMAMPPGVNHVIMQYGGFGGWRSWGSGRYRYTEQAFDVNEQICASGFVMQAPQTGWMQLVPINEETIEAKYPTVITPGMDPEEVARRKLNKTTWKDMKALVRGNPAVLLSDDPMQYMGINISLIVDLPPWMINANPQWGAPMAVPIDQQMQPQMQQQQMSQVMPAGAQQQAYPAPQQGYQPPMQQQQYPAPM